MTLRKIAAMFVALGLAIGLVGAGISTTFTDGGTATQQINIGDFGISLASDTPGAVVSNGGKTLTCPLLTVSDSEPTWDFVGCHVQITSSGAIAPDAVKLYVEVTTPGGNPDLSKFAVQFNEGAGSWSPNMYGDTPMLNTLTAKTLVSTTSVVPADLYTYLGWPLPLDNDELNSVILVTFSIEAEA